MVYIIDFETGGLSAYKNAVSSVCIKEIGRNNIFYNEFYPQKSIYEYSALAVNRISLNSLFKVGVSRHKLIDFIGNLYESQQKKQNYLVFAGWNVMFDIDFLLQVYKSKGLKLPCPIVALDLCEIAKTNIKKKDGRKKEDEGIENYKLATVYNHFFPGRVDEEQLHTAQYDVEITEELFVLFLSFGWIDKEML